MFRALVTAASGTPALTGTPADAARAPVASVSGLRPERLPRGGRGSAVVNASFSQCWTPRDVGSESASAADVEVAETATTAVVAMATGLLGSGMVWMAARLRRE